jgi:hypothetical protein
MIDQTQPFVDAALAQGFLHLGGDTNKAAPGGEVDRSGQA